MINFQITKEKGANLIKKILETLETVAIMKFKCADETNYTNNDLCFCSFNPQNYGRNGMMLEK